MNSPSPKAGALEQHLAALVAHASVAIFALDAEGRFTAAEGMGLAALGLRPGEAVGRRALEACRDAPNLIADLARALAGHAFCSVVQVGRLWWEVHYLPHFNLAGRLQGVVALALDVTRRKRAEAEAADRAKNDFLAIISHELRTPMTSILGWNWLLRSGELGPGDRERAMEVIEHNVQLQKRIIEDLLDVSSLACSKLALKRREVDLGAVVRDAAAGVRGDAQAKGINLTCSAPPGILVDGDPERLRQIFSNLAGNAVKFTPKGGEVRLHLRREESRALVFVEDTGPGISPKFFPHLFELFRQQEESLTRAYRGLGLGLAIAKFLAELHGGSVRAEAPAPSQGARFVVALPLRGASPPHAALPSPAAAEEPRQAAAGRSRFPEKLLRGIRVLIVDDDDDTRQMLTSVVAHCGASAEAAAGAQEALALFARIRPDVLVSDIAMPGEDGYSLMRRIRALRPEEGGLVAAAALTAYASAEDQEEALRAGFQLHLPKPVDPVKLVAAVRALAGKAGAPGP